ncbi:hypothetical protein ABEG75_19960 [Pantoea agglomerans]|uniref:Lipoprotein n=1 Tax=Enterobacter agglomerans TaxID=549 RepID=A0A7X2MM76_ENTAG|nr:hypothetical protein [Pantoea agglomerans]KEY40692.1 hypothetical protein FB99_41590 [Pantoea agglomerans]MSE15728.1 hypothetical protein [Pantoea agglomerans]QAV47205.1 hypothetical protein D1629_21605 [Pantoea agglomerans]QAV51667.1 hypothetical protein D1628_20550 [Pantoea agglomerans]
MNKSSLKAFPLLRVLTLTCVPMLLLGCASALCPFGTTEGTVPDFKNSYWRSTEKKPAKTNEQVLEECTHTADAEEQRLSQAYLQLCKTGHITGENQRFAQKLLGNPLFSGSKTAKAVPQHQSDESVEAQLRWPVTYSDNPKYFKEICGYYVEKNAAERSSTMLGLQVGRYKEQVFKQCMAENHMALIVPNTEFSKCDMISW